MMIFVNAVYKKGSCPKEYAEGLIKMLSPITPHIGEEIWQIFGHTDTIAYEKWPEYSEDLAREDEIEIAIQVNGKVKSTVKVGREEDEASVKAKVWADENIKRLAEGRTVVKEIYVKGRIYTLVMK
jgi:leucyl-tRNA synthetase